MAVDLSIAASTIVAIILRIKASAIQTACHSSVWDDMSICTTHLRNDWRPIVVWLATRVAIHVGLGLNLLCFPRILLRC